MARPTARPRMARKLLTASIGVATISYVTAATSCSSSSTTNAADANSETPQGPAEDVVVGNLAPLPVDAQEDLGSTPADAAADAPSDTATDILLREEFIVGNLAPPPRD